MLSDVQTDAALRHRDRFNRLSRCTLLSGGLLLVASMFLSVGAGCPGSYGRIPNWARPIDDGIGLIESIIDWRYPRPPQTIMVQPSSAPIPLPFNLPPRELLDERVQLVFGYWIPTFIAGAFAIVVAVVGPGRRYRWLLLLLIVSHLMRWPILSTWTWWTQQPQGPGTNSALGLLRFPSVAGDHAVLMIPFFLPPLLLIHALVLFSRARRPGLAVLFFWALYFIGLVLVFTGQNAIEFWGELLSNPGANSGRRLGLVTLFLGAWLVLFGSMATAWSTAKSRGDFIGLLFWGSRAPPVPGICEKCEYPVVGLTSDRCPECGTPINPPNSEYPDAKVVAG